MKYYAVLDTNVLVSAMLKAGSVPGLVTGNLKHFPVKTYIVTPREMLDMVKEAGK
ncbi:MAG: hypothetical protein K6G84_11825 [Lachnospiraceae bacterium]|nr:hypothetical protein [Lachnospiraceae bacterium]